eukprot:451130_1
MSMLFNFLCLILCIQFNNSAITLYTINCSQLSGNEVLLGESIQGLYALQTNSPSLWFEINGWSDSSLWLNSLAQEYGQNIIYNNSFQSLNDIISLTNYLLTQNTNFKINGYLKANITSQSLHYALSLAFHYNALIATDDKTENALKSLPLNLKLLRDFTTDRTA